MGRIGGLDRHRWTRLVAVVAAVCLVVPGAVIGSSLKVSKGTVEHDRGLYVAAGNLGSWWVAAKFIMMNVPGTVPPLASGSAARPTALPNGSAEYVLANATGGATAVAWFFTLTSGAPLSSEVELEINVSIASGPAIRLTIFLETNASAVTGPATIRLFIPTSGIMPSEADIGSSTVRSLACTTVGNCP